MPISIKSSVDRDSSDSLTCSEDNGITPNFQKSLGEENWVLKRSLVSQRKLLPGGVSRHLSFNQTQDQRVRSKKPKVMLVNDERITLMILESMLIDQCGITHIDKAKDGEEAIELILQSSYDLVLMDLNMPKIDGFQASLEIRRIEKHKQPVIIAVSAACPT